VASLLSLGFHNPDQAQFTYDLEVLGQLNLGPGFTTAPVVGIVAGQNYTYDSNATDPESDTLTYSLVSGPDGLTIDDESGELEWETTSGDVGQHSIDQVSCTPRATSRAQRRFGHDTESATPLHIDRSSYLSASPTPTIRMRPMRWRHARILLVSGPS
jgi:hypothetical protein